MVRWARWDLQIFSLETFFLQPAASPVGHQGRFAELVRRRRRLLLRVQRLLLRRGSKADTISVSRCTGEAGVVATLQLVEDKLVEPPLPRATSRARTPRARCVLSQRCFI